jgi:hypothetical protein
MENHRPRIFESKMLRTRLEHEEEKIEGVEKTT